VDVLLCDVEDDQDEDDEEVEEDDQADEDDDHLEEDEDQVDEGADHDEELGSMVQVLDGLGFFDDEGAGPPLPSL